MHLPESITKTTEKCMAKRNFKLLKTVNEKLIFQVKNKLTLRKTKIIHTFIKFTFTSKFLF